MAQTTLASSVRTGVAIWLRKNPWELLYVGVTRRREILNINTVDYDARNRGIVPDILPEETQGAIRSLHRTRGFELGLASVVMHLALYGITYSIERGYVHCEIFDRLLKVEGLELHADRDPTRTIGRR